MAYAINLDTNKRAERKALIHVAVWDTGTSTTPDKHTVILGKRTPDSSIEFNPDVETSTDILGINYTDVNKTQPQQSFDPAYIIGGDELMAYMNEKALSNDINAYNGVFNVYVIAAYLSQTSGDDVMYRAFKHKGCSIIPDSIGGESYVSMPFNVYYSNDIVPGYVEGIDATSLSQLEAATSATFHADAS